MGETIPQLLQLLSGDLQILYKAKAPILHTLRHLGRLFVQYMPHDSTVYLSTHNCTLENSVLFFGDSLPRPLLSPVSTPAHSGGLASEVILN